MNELVIDVFAIIGAVSCCIWAVKGVKALSRKRQAEAAPEPPAAMAVPPPAVPEPPGLAAIAGDDIAVIAAAVCAMLGSPRILRIEDGNRSQIWTAEGRWMHQTSHTPHRA
jgi:hypothetical protein